MDLHVSQTQAKTQKDAETSKLSSLTLCAGVIAVLCVIQCNELYQHLLEPPYSNMHMREALSALFISLMYMYRCHMAAVS